MEDLLKEENDQAIKLCPMCGGKLVQWKCVRKCTICENRFFIMRTFKSGPVAQLVRAADL